jgi:hypothetical protein
LEGVADSMSLALLAVDEVGLVTRERAPKGRVDWPPRDTGPEGLRREVGMIDRFDVRLS